MLSHSFLNLQSFSHHKASAVILIRDIVNGYKADAFIHLPCGNEPFTGGD